MILDLHTLLLVFGPLSALLPILAWIALGDACGRSGRLWFGSALTYAAAMVLVANRTALPLLLGVNLAQLLILGTAFGYIAALRIELRLQPPWRWFVPLAVAQQTGLLALLHWGGVVSTLVFVSSVFVVMDLVLIQLGWRLFRSSASRGILLMLLGVGVTTTANIARIVGLLSRGPQQNAFAPSWDLSLSAIGGILVILTTNFGFYGYVLEKMQRAKSKAENDSAAVGAELDLSLEREAEMQALIRERDEMLRMLSHSNRVSTVETLSSGLSHEINQPLATILLHAQTARAMAQDPTLDRAQLTAVLDAVIDADKRASAVVQRIRQMIRNAPIELQKLNLTDAVASVLDVITPELLRQRIALHTELGEHPLWIDADPTLLHQAVLNLLLNAIDALSSQGATAAIHVEMASTADAVSLTIGDNGLGIPAERRAKLFEPFQSGKPQGLGLGLAITRSIMHRIGGEVTLLDDEAGWTRFRLVFTRNGPV